MKLDSWTKEVLKSIGVNPKIAAKSIVFSKTGTAYEVVCLIGKQHDSYLFRVLCDGKPETLTTTQIRAIFA